MKGSSWAEFHIEYKQIWLKACTNIRSIDAEITSYPPPPGIRACHRLQIINIK
jgi:hypothetical protein